MILSNFGKNSNYVKGACFLERLRDGITKPFRVSGD